MHVTIVTTSHRDPQRSQGHQEKLADLLGRLPSPQLISMSHSISENPRTGEHTRETVLVTSFPFDD